ncbi:CBS domain-containing protein [Desulfotomaculum copahuensis]|uniref:CBS domain-containing protein n=1 Tax=Desulfotomaculum copahuensis TaxID=1838280 RepID=A0A1B7LD06_9FIRM|nr:CBS domain-containing protein [Desulfotomaculum copahuensis]OAT80816.1 CBS domain-containing protein [Desulfotomaculum copahuensis]
MSLLVKDVMVPVSDYSTVSGEATVREAISALRGSFHREGRAWHGHYSVLVLDREGRLAGLLTLRSLLRAVGFKDLTDDIWIKAESWGWYFMEKMQTGAGVRVRDIMRPLELATVNARQTLKQAAHLLLTHQVNSLPVLEDGKVTGILRTIDVFRAIDEIIPGI